MRLSVIIPTLNEADYLPETIRTLRANRAGPAPEMVVADCRSTDGTPRVAKAEGARVVERGNLDSRAAALNAGAAAATGDTYLFLHADSCVPPGYDAVLDRALARPDVLAGVFDFAFAGRGLALRLFEVLNRVRARVEGRPFGDQGFFVRAAGFRRLGGFPHVGILEDARFSDAVTRAGRLAVLRERITVSSRRICEEGALAMLWQCASIWCYDLVGQDVTHFGPRYTRNNRRRAPRVGQES